MAHSYRNLQNWNQWLSSQFLGRSLLAEEGDVLFNLLKKHYGKHALLIGVSAQQVLFSHFDINYKTLMSPPLTHDNVKSQIESDLHELPILSGSVDLVILPHTLELVENPRQLFSEACRIVKPEGMIAIVGFNPYSLWGMKSAYHSHLIQAQKIKGWLKLADFSLESHRSLLFRPPIKHDKLYHKLRFMEKIGRVCFSAAGGGYILLARAKVIPLTPIRLKWKQQLEKIHIPSTITGHIARQSK